MKSDLIELGIILSREFPDCDANDLRLAAVELCRIAKRLDSLNEVDCNYGLSKRQETTYERLCERAGKIAASTGAKALFNNDPRGPSVLLALPSGRTNDWVGRGWIIPTK